MPCSIRPRTGVLVACVACICALSATSGAQIDSTHLKDFFAMYDRAEKARISGSLAVAKATYDSVVARNPAFAPALFQRGVIENQAGDTASGMRDVRRASALGYNVADSYLQLMAAPAPRPVEAHPIVEAPLTADTPTANNASTSATASAKESTAGRRPEQYALLLAGVAAGLVFLAGGLAFWVWRKAPSENVESPIPPGGER
jgi:hypothetical protein